MRNIMLIAAITLVATLCMAWPTGGPYELRWGSYTNGGTETEPRVSSGGYVLTDNLGHASTVTDSFLTDGTAYKHRPGYRKVEWDEQPPITMVNHNDSLWNTPGFVITWGGEDTTTSDGIGWGIRYYDVEFRRGPAGEWKPWLTNSTFTSGLFGPFVPDTVFEDTVYYFQCRAHDLPGNVEEWPPTWQAWARYNSTTLDWTVYNYDGENYWTISDSIGLNETVTADSANVFLVKNTGTETIDIGIKGSPATGWDLGATRGINRYGLRAYFNDDNTPPLVFDFEDAVLDTGFAWSSATVFGPGGFEIQDADADSVLRTENLWLQLLMPTELTHWTYSQVIRLDLKARVTTP